MKMCEIDWELVIAGIQTLFIIWAFIEGKKYLHQHKEKVKVEKYFEVAKEIVFNYYSIECKSIDFWDFGSSLEDELMRGYDEEELKITLNFTFSSSQKIINNFNKNRSVIQNQFARIYMLIDVIQDEKMVELNSDAMDAYDRIFDHISNNVVGVLNELHSNEDSKETRVREAQLNCAHNFPESFIDSNCQPIKLYHEKIDEIRDYMKSKYF